MSSPTSTSVDQSVDIQATQGILVAPIGSTPPKPTPNTGATISFAFENQSPTSTVYAYVTGLAINNNNAVYLLEADGQTGYYPSNPTSNGSPLAVNCAVPLGGSGSTTVVTIPQLAGGRVWFSYNDTLTFLLNPGNDGPALVEPSVTNPSDPNINIQWDFCEFTYNSSELYVNISYVDFVSIPVALTLLNNSGVTTHVSGIPANGLDTICSNLVAQNAVDGAGWDQLVVTNNGSNLRANSPNNGILLNNGLFGSYYDAYVDQVWSMYSATPLTIDTQAQWGDVSATVVNDQLTFGSVGSYSRPTAANIFSCSSGPFAASAINTDEMGALTARLTAAFNRSTLLIDALQPDNENPATYYQNATTNHYARIVHGANLDGKGYTFPYDDVAPSDGTDQSGYLADGDPSLLTITVGGGNAYSKAKRFAAGRRSVNKAYVGAVGGSPFAKRAGHGGLAAQPRMPMFHQKRAVVQSPLLTNSFMSADEEKAALRVVEVENTGGDLDLESGEKGRMLLAWEAKAEEKFPVLVQRILESRFVSKLRSYAEDPRVRPFINIINSIIAGVLSLTMRAFLSRMFLVLFMLIVYVVVEMRGGNTDAAQKVGFQLLSPAGNSTSVGM